MQDIANKRLTAKAIRKKHPVELLWCPYFRCALEAVKGHNWNLFTNDNDLNARGSPLSNRLPVQAPRGFRLARSGVRFTCLAHCLDQTPDGPRFRPGFPY
jgi:hypothetical protein